MHTKTRTSRKHKRNVNQHAVSFMPRDPDSQRILRERAERIATLEVQQDATETKVAYVRFQLGEHDYYGIPYHAINEVMHKPMLTKVPGVPEYIAGIINRRGMLISILDLRNFFNTEANAEHKDAYIIVVTEDNMTIGIMVDAIEGSDTLDPTLLDAPLPSAGIIKPEYILGLHNGVTAIINIEAIMADLLKQLTK